MERELLLTGIGGQGVQLAARTIATAAIAQGLEAMVFGVYGGSMRGGNTDATVVLADQPLLAPPTVDRAWSALVMHHEYWPAVRERLTDDAIVVVDTSVFRGPVDVAPTVTVIGVDASTIATAAGNERGGSMVALGAYAAATGIVSLSALEEAARSVLPPYRARFAGQNVEALQAGWATVPKVAVPAWPAASRAGAAR